MISGPEHPMPLHHNSFLSAELPSSAVAAVAVEVVVVEPPSSAVVAAVVVMVVMELPSSAAAAVAVPIAVEAAVDSNPAVVEAAVVPSSAEEVVANSGPGRSLPAGPNPAADYNCPVVEN